MIIMIIVPVEVPSFATAASYSHDWWSIRSIKNVHIRSSYTAELTRPIRALDYQFAIIPLSNFKKRLKTKSSTT